MTSHESTFVPAAALETRSDDAGRHMLEGLCVPFDQITTKAGPRPERFVRGAFGGLDASSARIRLTDYNHGKDRRPVGIASVLEERSVGLWGRFRFYDTPEGRAAFENVQEETYGGLSIGFVAREDAIVDGVREIRAATLHHVSLVDEPAYDDARIVAVRSALDEYAWLREPRPALDVVDPGWLSVLIGPPRMANGRQG